MTGPIVPRYAPEEVKAPTLRDRLSRAIGVTLDQAGMSRADIAAGISEWVGTPVSKGMLDCYASQAREQNTITAMRLLALVAVTGDARALNLLLEDAGLIVVDRKYEALLRREEARERRMAAEREEQEAEAEWQVAKGGRNA